MDRDAAGQAQGQSRGSGGEERPQGLPPGARAGGCLGGRAGLIGVGGCTELPQTPSVFDGQSAGHSDAPTPSDLWSPEALAELAALAEEVLPRRPLRTLCPVKPAGSLFGLPLIPCPNQPEHNPMTFTAGLLAGACLFPFSPCASADPAGGEPALKE